MFLYVITIHLKPCGYLSFISVPNLFPKKIIPMINLLVFPRGHTVFGSSWFMSYSLFTLLKNRSNITTFSYLDFTLLSYFVVKPTKYFLHSSRIPRFLWCCWTISWTKHFMLIRFQASIVNVGDFAILLVFEAPFICVCVFEAQAPRQFLCSLSRLWVSLSCWYIVLFFPCRFMSVLMQIQ